MHGVTSPDESPSGQPAVVSWSGGKDSALALAALRNGSPYRPVALLTAITREYDRVSIHGVRRELLHAQARAIGLPLLEMWLPPRCSNEEYEAALATALSEVVRHYPTVRAIAFGDLFLEDVRRYREERLRGLGFEPLFPIWGQPTRELAYEFVRVGYDARLVCVDTEALPSSFAGRRFDASLLADLPPHVDPCGERGEFHTFVSSGPGFVAPVHSRLGRTVLRDGRFAYSDLEVADTGAEACAMTVGSEPAGT